jgi:hypothetical protein
MKQDELNLVLDALKFCHGGEPCGTAEAIAVIEKALAQRSEPSGKPSAWVGLTNEELTDLFYNANLGQQSAVSQAIALLKERNS